MNNDLIHRALQDIKVLVDEHIATFQVWANPTVLKVKLIVTEALEAPDKQDEATDQHEPK